MIESGRVLRMSGTAAVIAGLVALVYVGWSVVRMQPSALPIPPATSENVRAVNAAETRSLVPGELLGQIRIARLGLAADIREGETDAVLQRGAGHLSDTPWLGQDGNVTLAGHRDTVFRALRRIKAGDVVEIATQEGTARYSVDRTSVVAPDDLSVLTPTGGRTLTLITCHPFTFIGAAPNRFVVRATEIAPPSTSP